MRGSPTFILRDTLPQNEPDRSCPLRPSVSTKWGILWVIRMHPVVFLFNVRLWAGTGLLDSERSPMRVMDGNGAHA